ncbi:MAG: UDP-N-acetylglucosamine pyrophosphorylase [Kiritimatiellaeota bacterium]|nr:UDP-N-acetylglucosamine pyrophosphorylase [Kiritimatiellota bacterium]
MGDRIIQELLARGVILPCPATVQVDDDVPAERIAPGVVVHGGCRLRGAATSIGPGCVLGAEAPVTVEHCQLGRGVQLKGGFVSGATFLDGASLGSGAHVRPGTLFEEEASGAHAVGLKQTILMPFVTLGSLINFCDVLMAGGTDRKNHSEVGSSYVHFNFTPHQDKATASLLGDVPRGVMLDQPPIFLGGQGGLVGPGRIGFGSVIPAGLVWRGDAPEDGLLLQPETGAGTRAGPAQPFQAGAYKSVARLVRNNLLYLGNLRALEQWYRHVRRLFMNRDVWALACHAGALLRLREAVDERIRRLGELAAWMPRSLELARRSGAAGAAWLAEQEKLQRTWPALEAALRQAPADDTGARERGVLLAALDGQSRGAYLDAVRALPAAARHAGTAGLQQVVNAVFELW